MNNWCINVPTAYNVPTLKLRAQRFISPTTECFALFILLDPCVTNTKKNIANIDKKKSYVVNCMCHTVLEIILHVG